MSPQRDAAKISGIISKIILTHAANLKPDQKNALIRRFEKIIEHYQHHRHTDNITHEFTSALMPLPIDITNKASLLNEALEAVKEFLDIKPLWYTSGTGL